MGEPLLGGRRQDLDAERWRRVGALFAAALELPRGERAGWLERECAGEPALRAELLELLLESEQLGTFLAPPALSIDPLVDPLAGRARIGSYRILRLLGRGGMGVVYLAEQEKPRRSVALKVLGPSALSSQAFRRFEHESRILARLQHPGIAQIYEAGTDEAGGAPRPWFAMEFVEGATLREHVERARLGTRARLALFVKVCEAVQHAHERGVVHRDLKPANILVDRSGQPKVLDFGVARATDSDLRLTTLRTDVGSLIGTLPYMSPEQVAGDSRALDARSDVYALGVVAYELLSGRLPHPLEGCTIPEAVRRISADEPSSLSSLDRVFRGDLDTIVAKCLEKDPARRYASAAELAADVQRHLAHEPVRARPPSSAYQLRKFARRNRGLVAGVAAAFLALLAGVAATGQQWLRAREGRAAAERQARRALEVKAFLQRMLASVDPEFARGRDVAVLREMLDSAARRVESELAGEPEVEADLRGTIGAAYHAIGLYEEAETHLRACLALRSAAAEPGDARAAEASTTLANLLVTRGELDEAELLFRKALAAERASEVESLETARTLTGLAQCLYKKCSDARTSTANEATLAEAAELLERAVALRRSHEGEESEELARSLIALAQVRVAQGAHDDGEALYDECLALLRRLKGDESRAVATVLYAQAELAERRGDLAAADELWRGSLAVYEKLLGPDHPTVAMTLQRLGELAMRRGKSAEAEPVLRRAVAIRRAGAEGERDLAWSLFTLAGALRARGERVEAEDGLREALEIYQRSVGPRHTWVAGTLGSLGGLLVESGRPDEAEGVYREALSILEEVRGPEHVQVGCCAGDLGAVLVSLGQPEEAEPYLRRCEALLAQGGDAFRARRLDNLKRLIGVLELPARAEEAAALQGLLAGLAAEDGRPR